MSNHLAIATVTAALHRALQSALAQDLSALSANVTHTRPDDQSNGQSTGPRVNLYLFQVTANPALRNHDLPTRDGSGRPVAVPQAALDLHYLLSFYGDESTLVPQQMLGTVARTLHARPVLTRAAIRETIADPMFSALAGSDLANALETVKFTPEPLSLEELSNLWSVFFQVPYVLSVAYQASLVLLDGRETPHHPLPVRSPLLLVTPATASAPGVLPNEIAGLVLWYRSDEGVTYDADGVSRWADGSGAGNDAVQSDPARRPAFVGHGIGSRPVLRFDGSDDRLAIENLHYDTAGGLSGLTVCALVRSGAAAAQIVVSFDRSAHWQLSLVDAPANAAFATTDAAPSTHDLRTPSPANDGRWHVLWATFERGATPDKRLFVDGEEVASANAHGGDALGTATDRFGYIGVGSQAASAGGATGPDQFLAGDLAELIVYERALTDAERAQLERYFADRYGP